MKLSDELNSRIKNAKSDAEVKSILAGVKNDTEKAGIILDDAELEVATGGNGTDRDKQYFISGEVPIWKEPQMGSPIVAIYYGDPVKVNITQVEKNNWYRIDFFKNQDINWQRKDPEAQFGYIKCYKVRTI